MPRGRTPPPVPSTTFGMTRWGGMCGAGPRALPWWDDTGDRPRLRYVFDISDTGTREHSRTPWLWQLEEQHKGPVSAMLERSYGASGDDLPQQIIDVAGKLAGAYWEDHRRDFFHIVDDSFLEEYDDYNIEMQFKAAATVSISYALMSRCGLEPERYFDREDFITISDFNSPATIWCPGRGSQPVQRARYCGRLASPSETMSESIPQKGA